MYRAYLLERPYLLELVPASRGGCWLVGVRHWPVMRGCWPSLPMVMVMVGSVGLDVRPLAGDPAWHES